MGITVREALRIGGLSRCRLAAGEKGLDRSIDSITVMEVPDVIRWLKGGVLLLTSLYPIKDDEQAIGQLVQQLKEAGCAALAIKTAQYVQEIPPTILNEGDRLGLPVIEIDNEVAYLDIMTPLMERILNRRTLGKEQLDSFFQWMTELAMRGQGTAAIVDAMEQMTHNPITVNSELPEMVRNREYTVDALQHGQKRELKAANRPLRMERRLNQALTSCLVAPIVLNDELLGDITCWQLHREFIEEDVLVLERSMVLLALEFVKALTKADVEQTYKDPFIHDILLGRTSDTTTAVGQALRYGWDVTGNHQVMSAAVHVNGREYDTYGDLSVKRRLLQCVNFFFDDLGLKVMATMLNGELVLICPQPLGDERKLTQLGAALRQRLHSELDGSEITVGIGRLHRGIEGIHSSYMESRKALQLGKPIEKDGCVPYEELGVYRILGSLDDKYDTELKSLYADTVGRLAAYDELHDASLVATLESYFANNGSVSDTADQLYVHVNTVKYRLQKIEQLTDCGVHDAEQRLLLHIGLKIHRLLKVNKLL
ncbi:PucR family transcriptional regulator ligand-binding domain-containing protein [Paenibacillus sp. GD4]|uniref:PucR family transcriptional regulator n=1 Tax=Paenibacillus sp. GD4 TaxID=3068890 RepID=UPI0027968B6B|nr:PucR family transcriptional regulator [Paenibacillus sp. GD4]MDQ1913530.1 PucR family transcriptional regulator ligand-binding domain-containing protein [Paenibacillus sp. GD4]